MTVIKESSSGVERRDPWIYDNRQNDNDSPAEGRFLRRPEARTVASAIDDIVELTQPETPQEVQDILERATGERPTISQAIALLEVHRIRVALRNSEIEFHDAWDGSTISTVEDFERWFTTQHQ